MGSDVLKWILLVQISGKHAQSNVRQHGRGCNLHADSRPCAPPPLVVAPTTNQVQGRNLLLTDVFKSHFICRMRGPHLGQRGGPASHDLWQLHKQLVVQVQMLQYGRRGAGNEIFPSHAIGGLTTTPHHGTPHSYFQPPTTSSRRGAVTTASMIGYR